MNKIIMHIDMDAFFASVEVRDNPELVGKPIAVVGPGKRTVIVSPSYEAREFGVKTGMTKLEAKRLCPQIIFVVAHSEKYALTCKEIIKILYSFTPDIEVYSIDEFFIDVTNSCHLFGGPKQTGIKIKNTIKKNLGLSCSIGISYNKLLAKIVSDINKPDGMFLLDNNNKDSVLEGLDVSSVWGIGPSTTKKLYNMGIRTLGDLRKISVGVLKKRFGVFGIVLNNMAFGIGDAEITRLGKEDIAKSIGHSMTFPKDTKDPMLLKGYLLELSKKTGERLRRENMAGKCISITVRHKDFHTFTKQKSINEYINTTQDIYKIACDILKSIDLEQPVRLLGVSVSSLKNDKNNNLFLFKEDEKRHNIDKVLDKLTQQYGEETITYASLISKKPHKRPISPAWRPTGTRNY